MPAHHPVKSLKRRKRKRSRHPYTRKEKHLVFLCGLQISIALWATGLTSIWQQCLFTSISVVGLIIAVSPQFYSSPGMRDPRLQTSASLKRLFHYPVFWSGFLLLFYIFLQSLNPSFHYTETSNYWSIRPIDHQHLLPTSVDAPFSRIDPIRLILVFSGVWMMQCYLKTGVIRRNSLLTLLWWICLNFVAMGILAIAQKQTHTDQIFWTIAAEPDFFGSVPRSHQAAALLNLGMAIAMGLYFLHLKAMRMELRHSGPHLIVLIVIVFIYGLLWSTRSQSGLLTGSLLFLAFLCLVAIPSLRDGSTFTHKFILALAMVVLAVSGVMYTHRLPDSELTIEKLGNLREEVRKLGSEARTISTQATMDMFRKKMLFGWGAGSWRYVFPYYQNRYEEIQYLDQTRTTPAVWADAHNDPAQFLAELGMIGAIILALFLLWPIFETLAVIRSIHLTQVILSMGLMALLAQSMTDYLLQNQSVLCLYVFVCFLINRLNIEQMSAPSQKRGKP